MGYLPGNELSNRNLKWEQSATANFGLDFGLWNSRLTGTIEYYRTHPTDLLVTRSLNASLGYTSMLDNLGETKTDGFDIGLNGDIIRNDVEQTREGLMLVPLGYDRVTRQTHGNKDFIVNSLLYLTDDEGLMQLRNRRIDLRLLNRAVVDSQRNMWMWINTLLPIVLLALFGGVFFWIRKKKNTL